MVSILHQLVFKNLRATWFRGPGKGPGEGRGRGRPAGGAGRGRGMGRGFATYNLGGKDDLLEDENPDAIMDEADPNRKRSSDQTIDAQTSAAALLGAAMGVNISGGTLALPPPPGLTSPPPKQEQKRTKTGAEVDKNNKQKIVNGGKNLEAKLAGSLEGHHWSQ